MKRQYALDAIRAHTFKGDPKLAMRVYLEHNTVSYTAYLGMVKEGVRMKNGTYKEREDRQNDMGDKFLAATFDGKIVRIV